MISENTQYGTVDLDYLRPNEVVAIKIAKGFDPITCISVYAYGPDRELLTEVKEKIGQLFIAMEDVHGEIIIAHGDGTPPEEPAPKERCRTGQ